MQSERQQVAMGAAIGGMIGLMMALTVSVWLSWFGLIIGALVGYVISDWQQVIEKVPEAIGESWNWIRKSRGWVKKPHPFWLFAFIVWCIVTAALLYAYKIEPCPLPTLILTIIVGPFMVSFISTAFFLISADAGGSVLPLGRKLYWTPSEYYESKGKPNAQAEGRTAVWVSYRLVYGLALWGILVGVVRAAHFLRGVVVSVPCFITRLVRLIHSDKRLLAGLHAAFAVVVVYGWMWFVYGASLPHVPPSLKLGAIVSGGIVGYVIGLCHHSIYTKYLNQHIEA